MDYNTIVNALFMGGDEYNRCTGCGKMTLENKLSSGRCDTCSAPAKEMPIAASLDMDAIVEKVARELTASVSVEAALSWDDAWVKIKTTLGLAKQQPPSGDHLDALMQAIQTTMPVQQQTMENTQDKAVQDVAEAGKALPRELRKRFPKT